MGLDKKDERLLHYLELNARAPHTEIAKHIGVSKQVVQYRIKRLEEKGIIQGYNAIIDVNKLGQTIYLIYFDLFQISTEEEERWIRRIDERPSVALTAKNAGQWDLTVVLICENAQRLDKELNEIIGDKAENIQDQRVTSEVESSYFNTGVFLDRKEKEIRTSSEQSNLDIDEKDEQILSLLAENCRLPLTRIGDEVGMSATGVKNRVKDLEDSGVILGYKTKINFEALDLLHFRVLVQTTRFDSALYENVKEFLIQEGLVDSVSRYLGYADVDFRCYAENINDFYTLIEKIRDRFVDEIKSVNSMLIYDWKSIKYYED